MLDGALRFPVLPALNGRPAPAAGALTVQDAAVDGHGGGEVQAQRVFVLDAHTVGLAEIAVMRLALRRPPGHEGEHLLHGGAHANVHDQPLGAGVHRRDAALAPGPGEEPVQPELRARLVPAAVEAHAPRLRLRLGERGDALGVFVLYFAVVEAVLQRVDIAPGVLHGREAELFAYFAHDGERRVRGRIFREIGVELPAAPAPALLDGCTVPAGEQQAQEIREILRHGVDIVRRRVHGADGENRAAVAAHKAVVYAVRALPAYQGRAARGAEIELSLAALHAQRREVYARTEELFVGLVHTTQYTSAPT